MVPLRCDEIVLRLIGDGFGVGELSVSMNRGF